MNWLPNAKRIRLGIAAAAAAAAAATLCRGQSVLGDIPLPQTIEVDLVFPRNETYAPLVYFPIVFAIRNPQAFWASGIRGSWDIWGWDWENGTNWDWNVGDLVLLNTSSSSGPYVMAWDAQNFVNQSGTYELRALFDGTNCTITPPGPYGGPPIVSSSGMGRVISVYFTIAAGGKAPDLLAGGPCPQPGMAFRIEEALHTNDSSTYDEDGSDAPVPCLLTAPFEDEGGPAPDPCGFRIDQTVVNNLTSAIMTRAGCNTSDPKSTPTAVWPNLTEPCPTKSGAAPRIPSPRGLSVACVLIGVVWLGSSAVLGRG
ncbi:hypothetical protein VTK73DRAFT_9059 [Phialemonium thermophilum]|uniref:DUF7136 domain-containing protein n=1 Tax=Phialemonium thermophilum TaxID=223376 RepID=A0ABR3W4U5_9PEZI